MGPRSNSFNVSHGHNGSLSSLLFPPAPHASVPTLPLSFPLALSGLLCRPGLLICLTLAPSVSVSVSLWAEKTPALPLLLALLA